VDILTRYLSTDTWTVNGLTAHKLSLTQGSNSATLEVNAGWTATVTFYKRTSGGTETQLASATYDFDSSPRQSVYIPPTVFAATDALRLTISSPYESASFITEQFGSSCQIGGSAQFFCGFTTQTIDKTTHYYISYGLNDYLTITPFVLYSDAAATATVSPPGTDTSDVQASAQIVPIAISATFDELNCTFSVSCVYPPGQTAALYIAASPKEPNPSFDPYLVKKYARKLADFPARADSHIDPSVYVDDEWGFLGPIRYYIVVTESNDIHWTPVPVPPANANGNQRPRFRKIRFLRTYNWNMNAEGFFCVVSWDNQDGAWLEQNNELVLRYNCSVSSGGSPLLSTGMGYAWGDHLTFAYDVNLDDAGNYGNYFWCTNYKYIRWDRGRWLVFGDGANHYSLPQQIQPGWFTYTITVETTPTCFRVYSDSGYAELSHRNYTELPPNLEISGWGYTDPFPWYAYYKNFRILDGEYRRIAFNWERWLYGDNWAFWSSPSIELVPSSEGNVCGRWRLASGQSSGTVQLPAVDIGKNLRYDKIDFVCISKPTGGTLRITFVYPNGQVVPNSIIPGNESGFVLSYADFSNTSYSVASLNTTAIPGGLVVGLKIDFENGFDGELAFVNYSPYSLAPMYADAVAEVTVVSPLHSDASGEVLLRRTANVDAQGEAAIIATGCSDAQTQVAFSAGSTIDALSQSTVSSLASSDTQSSLSVSAEGISSATSEASIVAPGFSDAQSQTTVSAESFAAVQSQTTVSAQSSSDAESEADFALSARSDVAVSADVVARALTDVSAESTFSAVSLTDVMSEATAALASASSAESEITFSETAYSEANGEISFSGQPESTIRAEATISAVDVNDADAEAEFSFAILDHTDAAGETTIVAVSATEARSEAVLQAERISGVEASVELSASDSSMIEATSLFSAADRSEIKAGAVLGKVDHSGIDTSGIFGSERVSYLPAEAEFALVGSRDYSDVYATIATSGLRRSDCGAYAVVSTGKKKPRRVFTKTTKGSRMFSKRRRFTS